MDDYQLDLAIAEATAEEKRKKAKKLRKRRRALYREAYMAALSGLVTTSPNSPHRAAVLDAQAYALETVNLWVKAMADLEAR